MSKLVTRYRTTFMILGFMTGWALANLSTGFKPYTPIVMFVFLGAAVVAFVIERSADR